MMSEYKGMYWMYDEESGEFHGEFATVEEAVETAMCLKSRDYYLTSSLEDGLKTLVTVEEFDELLTKRCED